MFNALKYTQEMEQAGFSREQAEVSVKILIEVMNDNFATKSDLFEVESRLRSDILVVKSDLSEVESRLRSEILVVKSDLSEMGTRLKSDILMVKSDLAAVKSELKSDIKELDYKLTIKLGMMLTAAVGITATLFKVLESFPR